MKKEKDEIVIKEFKTSTPGNARRRRKKDCPDYVVLGAFCLVFLLAVLAGMILLKIPVVPVCIILILESLTGICLHDTPVWVHGIEVLISIVAGVVFGQPVFMLLGAAVYLAVVFALHQLGRGK